MLRLQKMGEDTFSWEQQRPFNVPENIFSTWLIRKSNVLINSDAYHKGNDNFFSQLR